MNRIARAKGHLSFEFDESGERLEIHGDGDGLERLAARLQSLLAKNESDHTHLMTSEWGGSDLSSEQENAEAKLINHVKIFRWE